MAYLDDPAEVQALIHLSSDDSNSDVAKREQAVHPSVWMFGQIGTLRTDVPIQQFFVIVQGAPDMAGPNDTAIVQSNDISGNTGVVVLAETDDLGCDWADHFNVARIDGRWQIANMTDAHTSGTPPLG